MRSSGSGNPFKMGKLAIPMVVGSIVLVAVILVANQVRVKKAELDLPTADSGTELVDVPGQNTNLQADLKACYQKIGMEPVLEDKSEQAMQLMLEDCRKRLPGPQRRPAEKTTRKRSGATILD
jgi:hypothetical protein